MLKAIFSTPDHSRVRIKGERHFCYKGYKVAVDSITALTPVMLNMDVDTKTQDTILPSGDTSSLFVSILLPFNSNRLTNRQLHAQITTLPDSCTEKSCNVVTVQDCAIHDAVSSASDGATTPPLVDTSDDDDDLCLPKFLYKARTRRRQLPVNQRL